VAGRACRVRAASTIRAFDVFVEPTRDGIIEGRDEVLEEALRQLLGADADESEIRRLAARP
jgi:hypothetical protein